MEIAGSGDVRAKGKTGTVAIRVSGSGDVHLGDLEARDGNVEVSGSGDVEVWASDSLLISVAGSGDVIYRGDPPKVTKSVAGSGSIRKR